MGVVMTMVMAIVVVMILSIAMMVLDLRRGGDTPMQRADLPRVGRGTHKTRA